MPPKKGSAKSKTIPFTVKAKRQGQTFFISVDQDDTITTFLEQLVLVINETGGLPVDATPRALVSEDGAEGVEGADADIEIPVPANADHNSDSDESDNDEGDDTKETINVKSTTKQKQEDVTKVSVTEDDITLMLLDSIQGEFLPVSEDQVNSKIGGLVQDYGVIGFHYKDDSEFQINKPVENGDQ